MPTEAAQPTDLSDTALVGSPIGCPLDPILDGLRDRAHRLALASCTRPVGVRSAFACETSRRALRAPSRHIPRRPPVDPLLRARLVGVAAFGGTSSLGFVAALATIQQSTTTTRYARRVSQRSQLLAPGLTTAVISVAISSMV
jgi:hypothetical protein